MQKYISKIDETEIRYFEDDVNVGDWIDLMQYRLMTESEIKKHETRKLTEFHTEWNGLDWIDTRSDEEKLAYKRSQYPKLTRYQFMRGMLEYGYKSSDIEAQIQTIEDDYQRELVLLGWQSATNFVRTDESVLLMQNILGWTDEQVDEMWTYAMTL